MLQRKHREENLLSNRDALDYLREIGVDRVACMVIMAKVCFPAVWCVVSHCSRRVTHTLLALRPLPVCRQASTCFTRATAAVATTTRQTRSPRPKSRLW